MGGMLSLAGTVDEFGQIANEIWSGLGGQVLVAWVAGIKTLIGNRRWLGRGLDHEDVDD